jgi:hypothetical protein
MVCSNAEQSKSAIVKRSYVTLVHFERELRLLVRVLAFCMRTTDGTTAISFARLLLTHDSRSTP